jgi:ABC-type microcin C transport system duplicated ATPase subunit YejF
MIFQEPMSSLNPSLKCGFQVQEILLQHTDLSTSETKGDTFAIREGKMPDPEIVFDKYLMRFQVDKTTRHDCDGDCLQTQLLMQMNLQPL